MPAKSKAQQRLMAVAENESEAVLPENKGVLGMKKSSLKDFASTKLEGLPEKTGKMKKMKNILAGMMSDKSSLVLQSIAKQRRM
jgi:hypothetical protein